MVKDMKVHFDMTMRQIAVFECLRAPHAQDFLLAIPIDGLGQHMSPVEYRTILKYRLGISLFFVDAICPVCRKACLNSFGEHAVHCKELPVFKYRHDMVMDVLFHIYISSLLDHPCNTSPSCDLVSLDQHAHTLCHLESRLTISLDNLCLDNLDIVKEDVEYQSSGSLYLELS
uniref:Auxilin-like protein n=1 Tax=Tanacetum cinerariifolium TaxID=118510 RepID=A0A6L2M662_TANCI|nr:auxilin-like protein [Tanacetum cinerariifolium]